MADGTDLAALRQRLKEVVESFVVGPNHHELAQACQLLGLPLPPPRDERTKRQRFAHSYATLSDADLPMVAARLLEHHRSGLNRALTESEQK